MERFDILTIYDERLGMRLEIVYKINHMNVTVKIKAIREVKICCIWFCRDGARQYKLNVQCKIDKLGSQLKMWKSRNLTFEGKVLITKVYGLSQVIYVMQVCNFTEGCIKRIEQLIHGFIWLGSRSDKERGVERIK